jgi:hypothetical protein
MRRRWWARQGSNLPQPIDIVQGGSDNHARYPGKTRPKQAEILTVAFCLFLAACASTTHVPSSEPHPLFLTHKLGLNF